MIFGSPQSGTRVADARHSPFPAQNAPTSATDNPTLADSIPPLEVLKPCSMGTIGVPVLASAHAHTPWLKYTFFSCEMCTPCEHKFEASFHDLYAHLISGNGSKGGGGDGGDGGGDGPVRGPQSVQSWP